MHSVLDENSAAFGRIPEPVLRPEALVGRVVLEITVQEGTERPAVDDGFYRVEQRVIALHEVRGEQQAALAGRRDERVCLLERDGQRLFADHVFAVLEGGEGLL